MKRQIFRSFKLFSSAQYRYQFKIGFRKWSWWSERILFSIFHLGRSKRRPKKRWCRSQCLSRYIHFVSKLDHFEFASRSRTCSMKRIHLYIVSTVTAVLLKCIEIKRTEYHFPQFIIRAWIDPWTGQQSNWGDNGTFFGIHLQLILAVHSKFHNGLQRHAWNKFCCFNHVWIYKCHGIRTS